MNNEYRPSKTGLNDKDLIEALKAECRRVKIQRNNYEQQLLAANRVRTELQLLENYINRKPQTTKS